MYCFAFIYSYVMTTAIYKRNTFSIWITYELSVYHRHHSINLFIYFEVSLQLIIRTPDTMEKIEWTECERQCTIKIKRLTFFLDLSREFVDEWFFFQIKRFPMYSVWSKKIVIIRIVLSFICKTMTLKFIGQFLMTFFLSKIVYRNEPDCLRRYKNPEPFNIYTWIHEKRHQNQLYTCRVVYSH